MAVLAWSMAALCLAATGFADYTPEGGNVLVNDTLLDDQTEPRVAMAADGSFAVVWEDDDADGSGEGIHLREFAADGSTSGADALVSQVTTDDQRNPAIARTPNASGYLVVVWESFTATSWDVHYRVHDQDQGVLLDEMTANSDLEDQQKALDVAMAPDGTFAIVWQGHQEGQANIYLRRFGNDGVALDAGDIPVNVDHASPHQDPAVAITPPGVVTVVWESDADGADREIWMRQYDAGGTPLTPAEVRVNDETEGDQKDPDVVSDPSGQTVVVWEGPGGLILGKMLPDGSEISVDDGAGSGNNPRIAASIANEFAVVWEMPDSDSDGIMARVVGSDGVPDPMVWANDETTGSQDTPDVAMSAGQLAFVVVWDGGPDEPDNSGCYAQRYAVVFEAPVVTEEPGDQTVVVGDTATFAAGAEGIPPPEVLWEFSANSGADWTSTGVTDTELAILADDIGALDGNLYRAQFVNGGGTATSACKPLVSIAGPSKMLPIGVSAPSGKERLRS